MPLSLSFLFISFFKSLHSGLPLWQLVLYRFPFLSSYLTSFSLGPIYASSRPSLDPCMAIPSTKSLHVLSSSTSRSQPQAHPLRVPPCPSVSRTHSPFSTPCLLSSSPLAVLQAPCFVWFAVCLSPSLHPAGWGPPFSFLAGTHLSRHPRATISPTLMRRKVNPGHPPVESAYTRGGGTWCRHTATSWYLFVFVPSAVLSMNLRC